MEIRLHFDEVALGLSSLLLGLECKTKKKGRVVITGNSSSLLGTRESGFLGVPME